MLEPFKFYKTNDGLKFYLINCGSGLTCLMVFPDDTVMLYDCNLVKNDENDCRNMRYILKFLKKVIPIKIDENGDEYQPIDIFVNSHRDTDHLKGLKEVNEYFPIISIWDSGFHGDNTDNADYNYYMELRRKVKKRSSDNLVVPIPSNESIVEFGEVSIYCLCSSEDYDYNQESAILESADKEQHTNCIVLLIYYADRKILLTGDSDWKAWKENIVPNFKNNSVIYEDIDILIASHHGSRTFFTCEEEIDEDKNPDTTYIESIRLIRPTITLISCAEYEYKGYHLPNREAYELYKIYTSNGQVYTTNDCGTFCGRIDRDGNYSVTPERFYNSGCNKDKRIMLKCVNDYGENIVNNSECNVGVGLKFKLNGLGNIFNSLDNVYVWWEVCNSGECTDDEHHEIYYKGKHEESGNDCFSRDLCFKGTHLLRCRVKNKNKNFDQTIVFVIHGR